MNNCSHSPLISKPLAEAMKEVLKLFFKQTIRNQSFTISFDSAL